MGTSNHELKAREECYLDTKRRCRKDTRQESEKEGKSHQRYKERKASRKTVGLHPMGYSSYLHAWCTMHEAYWFKKLDYHGQDGTVEIIPALDSGDHDSDPSFSTYWLYVLVEVIKTF